MPTYEYQCNECGHSFEKFQSMSSPPLQKCPECGGSVRRLIGAGGGVILKGGTRSALAEHTPACGRDTPCCGSGIPCDSPNCER